ncbi:MAG TPA: DMT family transporter [Herpetosiphonaceae bacterium]|nr:DMT family transporter [Herpetosiphonaceae bacterium]
MRSRPWLPYVVLLGGVSVASTAAIMITSLIGEGVGLLAIATGRLGFAALILTPIALAKSRDELRRLSRREIGLALLSGVFLAIHFAAWISSLAFTSVASSTALVTTNPIFVALVSWLIWRERLGRVALIGIALSFLGSLLIALSDRSGGSGSSPLLGDFLALVGALFVTGYLLAGRELRRHMHILPYIWLVYSTAAVILLLWMVIAGQTLLGFPPHVYLLLVALAVGPQLLGHTSFNWSIKYLSATFVAVAILGEPISSTVLALILLPNQQLQALQLAGGIVLMLGITVATLAERGDERRIKIERELQEVAAP